MGAFDSLPLRPGLAPMGARSVDSLPQGEGWQFEPKWDGFRFLLFRAGGEVDLRSKSGKPLGRYFPEAVELARSLSADRFVLDGELIIQVGGVLSFEALQLRLHPAESRVRKLALETPVRLILFDLLFEDRTDHSSNPLSERRPALEDFHAREEREDLQLSPCTCRRDVAEHWLGLAGGALDGVVAKRRDQPYRPGERAMLKVKNIRTADCVVGGFRYASAAREVGSLLLGLYNDQGLLDHVGFTSAIPAADRAALIRRLEALVEPPGFTGRAPGGPSRWATERSGDWQPLRPELVVEVRFDHVTGDRFRHGTGFVRWRPDKAPEQCRMDQLRQAAAWQG